MFKVVFNEKGCLRHDVVALQVCTILYVVPAGIIYTISFQAKRFMYTGQLISLSVVHCGSSFAFFSPALYKYISGCSVSEIVIGNEDVGNEEAKAVLEKVNWF